MRSNAISVMAGMYPAVMILARSAVIGVVVRVVEKGNEFNTTSRSVHKLS